MVDKPLFKPEWATDDVTLPLAGTANKERPLESLRKTGYDYTQYNRAQYYNWQFNNIFEWIDYLESITDAVGITDLADQAQAEAGTINTALMTPLRVRQAYNQYGLGGSRLSSGADLNTITRSGFYFTTSALNAPVSGTTAHVLVEGFGNTGQVKQTFTLAETNTQFSRLKNAAGTWSAWSELYNSGNNDLVGSVVAFAMTTAPSGYLKADGQAVSRTTYAALFSRIGTTWGVGDGTTTFNLPDYRGEFLRGFDDSRGVDTGRVFGNLQNGAIQAHDHPISLVGPGLDRLLSTQNWIGNWDGVGDVTSGPSGGSETRPRNQTVLYCIKY